MVQQSLTQLPHSKRIGNEPLWHAIFEANPECVKLINEHGELLAINPAGLAILESPCSEQIQGHCVYPLIVESYRQSFQDLIARIFRGESGELEFEITTLNGTRLFMEMRAVPLRNEQQQVIALLGTSRNITERKKAEMELRAVQDRHMQFFHQNARPMWFYDTETLQFLDVNQSAIEAYGYSREEFLAITIADIRPLEDIPKLMENLKLDAVNRLTPRQFRHRKKDGTTIDVDIHSHDLPHSGRAARLVAVSDITGQIQAETSLRESEKQLQSMLTGLDNIVWSMTGDARQVLYLNPATARVYGRAVTDFYNNPNLWLEAVYPPDQPIVESAFATLLGTGLSDAEYRIVRPSGELRWLHNRSRLICDEQGIVIRIDGLGTDITERKHAKSLLEMQTRVLQRLALGDDLSAILHEITQLAEARHPGLLCSILLLNEDGQHVYCAAASSLPDDYNQAINGMAIGEGRGSCGTAAFRKKTVIVSDIANDPLWADFCALALQHNLRACWSEPILSQTGQVLGTLAMYYSKCRSPEASELEAIQVAANLAGLAIERNRAEERLNQQAALLNLAQEAIISTDLEGRILFWNRGAERIYGWTAEEVLGRNMTNEILRDPEVNAQDIQKLFRQSAWQGERPHRTKDGKNLIVEVSWTIVYDEKGKPKGKLGVNRDITEKKALEAQFLRAQRLESIGTLASGIAHDLNNVLSPMAISVYLLRLQNQNLVGTELCDTLDELIERGANMVKHVVSFAKGSSGEQVVLNPRQVLREIVSVLKEAFPKSITINYQVSAELQTILGDPTQLHQVLMNLCINARDAMLEGGTLTITAQNVVVDEFQAGLSEEGKPGRFVQITVADTGVGISPDIRPSIFDPFFTTKESGKGTGLGLPTVQGIVRGHNGYLNVYSEIGHGTEFRIYLPIVDEEQPIEAAVALTPVSAGKGELILVVDDEPAIRQTIQKTLEASGYQVLTAAKGSEAVALCSHQQQAIQAVLVDMMMPGMDGPATIRALQKINPTLNIVASSGLVESIKLEEARHLGVKRVLLKPYTAESLLRALADVMNGNGAKS